MGKFHEQIISVVYINNLAKVVQDPQDPKPSSLVRQFVILGICYKTQPVGNPRKSNKSCSHAFNHDSFTKIVTITSYIYMAL